MCGSRLNRHSARRGGCRRRWQGNGVVRVGRSGAIARRSDRRVCYATPGRCSCICRCHGNALCRHGYRLRRGASTRRHSSNRLRRARSVCFARTTYSTTRFAWRLDLPVHHLDLTRSLFTNKVLSSIMIINNIINLEILTPL